MSPAISAWCLLLLAACVAGHASNADVEDIQQSGYLSKDAIAKANAATAKAKKAAADAAKVTSTKKAAGFCAYDEIAKVVEPQGSSPPLHFIGPKRWTLSASGAGCSKGGFVANGKSCSFKLPDATAQKQGFVCEDVTCKSGMWSTHRPQCCCISKPDPTNPFAACQVKTRCLKCPSGDKATWIKMSPASLDKIEPGKTRVALSFQNKGATGYMPPSGTSISMTTETNSRALQDKVQVYRNAPRAGKPKCYGSLSQQTRVISMPPSDIGDTPCKLQITYSKGVLCSGTNCAVKVALGACRAFDGIAAGSTDVFSCANGNHGTCDKEVTESKSKVLAQCLLPSKYNGAVSRLNRCGARCTEKMFAMKCEATQFETSGGKKKLRNAARSCSPGELLVVSTLL